MALLTQSEQQYYNGNDFGNYQFISLDNIISQFLIAYVGEDKIISKIKRADVSFHAQRALQELSFDTLKSIKAQEITVPASLQMILPQDYVNYTKISCVDSSGIKRLLYPVSKTSNPSSNPFQNDDGLFKLQAVGRLENTSTSIPLDGEYKDIIVGMLVVSPYIPVGTAVTATSNDGGITTISIDDGSGTNFPTQSNPIHTITFEYASGDLVVPQKESYIVEGLSWLAGGAADFKITASAAADIADIEVGMLVSNQYFPIGTTVLNVSGTTVVVDQNPINEQSGVEVTFFSTPADTDTWSNYKSTVPSENNINDYQDYQNATYWPNPGARYGLDPQHAQANGSFYIDTISGKIHFSSNISGKTVILDYISDSLGTEAEMQVHKFAEEAMYKWIAYGIMCARANVPEYQVNRFRKEKFAATRQAKLRLSNLKIEELTQILRGKSKQIKH
tara:strand:- start:16570 stop:17913 length:1344 start_codon:yes stop_codon:yes gene_type:complete